MCSGLAIVLTRKEYKEHHWLVVPHQPLQLTPTSSHLLKCLPPPALSWALLITSVLAVPLSMFVAKLVTALTRVVPLRPSCTTRRNIV